MPVVLENPYTPPTTAYDKIHLESLFVLLEATDYARTQIQARIRPYYRDAEGHKVFSPESRDILVDDAEKWITELAQHGDLRGVEAGNHIKSIVALLVATKTDLGTAGIA